MAICYSLVSSEVFFKCLEIMKDRKEDVDYRSLSGRFNSRIFKKHESAV
jgi:hypothetical protein